MTCCDCMWYGDGQPVNRCACVCHVTYGHSRTVPPPPPVPTPQRIPVDAIAAVERVLAFRANAVCEVPGTEAWRTRAPSHHVNKAIGHALEALEGLTADHETGEDPIAHAAARLLFALALRERGKK